MSGGPRGVPEHDPVRQRAAQWFARLRAEDVSELDRLRWRQWMDADSSHRDAWERLQAGWHEMGAWASEPAVVDRVAAVVRAPAAAMASARSRSRRWRWLSAAAAVAGMSLFAAWWVHDARPQVVEYATAIGESRTVVLDDGTTVDLDTDTRLSVAYSKRARVVQFEQGRAHFDVVRDGRPLRVQALLGEIRVVGTVFEVDQHAGVLDVMLVEGRVDVVPAGAGGASGVVEQLQPGQRLSIAGDGRLTRTTADAQARSWRTGRLVFDDLSLAEAVAEFNRYSQTGIRLADPSLAGIRVSGAFRNDDPGGFIEALHLLYGVSSSRDAAGNLVLSRH